MSIPSYHPDQLDEEARMWLNTAKHSEAFIQKLTLRHGQDAYLLNVESIRCGYHPSELPNELKQVLKHAAANDYNWIIIGSI